MFISKKKYEKALAEQKAAVTAEFERKMAEHENLWWKGRSMYEEGERNNRRFLDIEKRIYALEKKVGIVEETVHCPLEVRPNY